MLATLRAAISLIALVGFFVFAVALSAAVIAVGVGVAHVVRNLGVWIVVIGAISAIGVLFALARMVTFRPPVKPGVDVAASDAPALWRMVTELAESAGTAAPAQIRLTHEVNAAVAEEARFFGFVGGVRRMYLGIPLLQGLTVIQLRAVLAHEFGHYSSAHTRLAPLAYRGWQGVLATVAQLKGNVIEWPLRFYAGLYAVMSLAMSRSQEREADRLMVALAGRSNSQAALREIHVVGAFWSSYFDRFLGKGWAMDLAPTADEFFGGFTRLLDARVEERARYRSDLVLPTEGTLLDSHPPTADRVEAMEELSDADTPMPDDGRPAASLITAFGRLAAATAEETFVFGSRERVGWDELAGRVFSADDRRAVEMIYDAASRLKGDVPVTLRTIVDMSAAGGANKLVAEVGSESSDDVVVTWYAALVRDAAVRSGAARWHMSWSEAVGLTAADGEAFDAESIAAELATAGTAHSAATRLASLGVDLDAAQPTPVPDVDVGEVIAGLADLKSADRTYDVLLIDQGLVLAEVPKDTVKNGFSRIDELVRGSSVAAMVGRHRFVPFDSITSATVRDRLGVTLTLEFRDGTSMHLKAPLSAERMTEESAEVFKSRLTACG